MIDLAKQKTIGIKQAKRTQANIYKKAKGRKLTDDERAKLDQQQMIIDRWERTSAKGWKL
jgi:hypothetical protein